jgi:chromosome segregation ATPase
MTQDSEIGRLEKFVAKLLDRFNALQAEKKMVDELLSQRDKEIVILEAELVSLKDERGEIGSRVSGLLGRIAAWEAEAQGDGNDASSNRDTQEGGVQGSLF